MIIPLNKDTIVEFHWGDDVLLLSFYMHTNEITISTLHIQCHQCPSSIMHEYRFFHEFSPTLAKTDDWSCIIYINSGTLYQYWDKLFTSSKCKSLLKKQSITAHIKLTDEPYASAPKIHISKFTFELIHLICQYFNNISNDSFNDTSEHTLCQCADIGLDLLKIKVKKELN